MPPPADQPRSVGPYAIDLEYVPWPTASADLRAQVAHHFQEAALSLRRETTYPGAGGNGETPKSGITWAATTLIVCLVAPAPDEPALYARQTHRLLAEVGPRLSRACSLVRASFPTLPLGVAVILLGSHAPNNQFSARSWQGVTTFHYAFSPQTTAGEIQAGMAALVEGGLHERGVYGWVGQEHRWVRL
jgi:hypothetical protein